MTATAAVMPVLYSMLLSLFVVVPLHRLRLASGALAVILLWNAAFNVIAIPEMWIYLPAVIVSALLGEIREGTATLEQ